MSAARMRLALVALVIASAFVAGGWMIADGFRVRNASASAKLFDQVMSHVASQYVDPVDLGTLYSRAAAGLVEELGDPHSVLLDSTRLAMVQRITTGAYGSLGLDLDVRDGAVNVVAALPSSPAEQAGIRAGDRIVAVDGKLTRSWTAEETRRALRGSPGSSVKLTIVRLGTSVRSELLLERERMYVRPVQRVLAVDTRIGYVQLRSFSDSAAIEVEAAVDSLYRAGARALVLDLRNNPGGLLAQGTEVADLFLDPGQPIVSLRGRTAESRRDYFDKRPQKWPDMRLTVLVDRGTASASEIVAGALQDHDRALVIGRPSYGKGSAQSVFSFFHGGGLKLTTARWYTPSGRNIDFDFAAADASGGAAADSVVRPAYRTDSGRVVFGGGGIVPDVAAGDSVGLSTPSRMLLSALGGNVRPFRQAIAAEAKVLAAGGLESATFVVTPEMRDALYTRLERAGIDVNRGVYDAGSELVDNWLGREATRVAFGRAAEARRLTLRDPVVQEAIKRLRSAGTTKELLKG